MAPVVTTVLARASRRRRATCLRVGACALAVLQSLVASVLPARAQSSAPERAPKSLGSPKAVALPPSAQDIRRQLTGTGFFVDDKEHLITARHVIDGCVQVLVAKDAPLQN